MNEKRKEHRFKAVLPLKVVYSRKEIKAFTENISRLGTYAELSDEVPAGEAVDVILSLPAYTKDASLTGDFRCKGSVFRSSPLSPSGSKMSFGTGIFFTVFAENADREKLSQFIDYLTVKEDQEIKEGLRRRKEKEETEKFSRQSHQEHSQQDDFQKESLRLLRHISSQLEEIQRFLFTEQKKK